MTTPVFISEPDSAPLDHVPVEPIRGPNWWLWAILIACAFAWAGILILIMR